MEEYEALKKMEEYEALKLEIEALKSEVEAPNYSINRIALTWLKRRCKLTFQAVKKKSRIIYLCKISSQTKRWISQTIWTYGIKSIKN